MLSGIESPTVKERQQTGFDPDPQEQHDETVTPQRPALGARVLTVTLRTAVAACLLATLTHVVLLFLHVAPPNSVSNRFSPQINAWVFPIFEQNWRLFAPEPDSVNRTILARTAHTAPNGSAQVSAWFDLSAIDNAAVEHNVFPSHTTQNLLRRAWTSYGETHGGDDTAHSDRAVMMQKYLRNIAVDRVRAHRDGAAFDFIQLRVLTQPIAAPGTSADKHPPTPADERLLPWWKVTSP
ncbi:DUF5819 family protein [Streptomyces sp. NPDC058655]|uniref:DUF5819 family protein n=1 Tax=Streptomyces sp. NPDC058655 TaxID=3346577 RepID=UPI00364C9960